MRTAEAASVAVEKVMEEVTAAATAVAEMVGTQSPRRC